MKPKIIALFGGSGFLGKYVIHELVKQGYYVNVISRNPWKASSNKVVASLGQITFTQANIKDGQSIRNAIKNADIVVNLVGILYETRHQHFSDIHARGAERIAQAAKKCGIEHMIQLSALGVDKATTSKYARSKLNGEKAVRSAFPGATLLRPSVIFGPEDNFTNKFADMARFSPCLPLIGGGNTMFQPIYVGDVAKAIVRIIAEPDLRGNNYELGGPDRMSFKDILHSIMQITHRKRYLVTLPFPVAKLLATFLQLLPTPPLTRDQVRLLKYDNVVSKKALGTETLGLKPESFHTIVPSYLES